MTTWTPASEKPGNGVAVLVRYLNCAQKQRIVRAQWIAARAQEANIDDECVDEHEYDEATDTYYIREGWYELVDNWDEYSFFAIGEGEVTHWCSMPKFDAGLTVTHGEG